MARTTNAQALLPGLESPGQIPAGSLMVTSAAPEAESPADRTAAASGGPGTAAAETAESGFSGSDPTPLPADAVAAPALGPRLEVLDAGQRAAVAHLDGPAVVLAGPGSGKTRVIVERLVHLHTERAIPLNQILVLTYTVGAAREMLDRARAALPDADEPRLLNFHGFSRQLLREHGSRVGLMPGWRSIADPEQWLIAREVLNEWRPPRLWNPLNPTAFVPALLGVVEQAKQELVTAEAYAAWAEQRLAQVDGGADPLTYDLLQRHADCAEFYARMNAACRRRNVLDYDDQILLAAQLLTGNPALVDDFTDGVRYVMIDEFQDTNFAQARLVEALAAGHSNVMVVADDDQAIYKFRGASLANLERFERLHPGARSYVLGTNYRSSPPIVAATRAVIGQADAALRRPKAIASGRGEGPAVELWQSANEFSEAIAMAREARRLMEAGTPASEITLLFGRHDDMEVPIKAFKAEGVPYQVHGGRGYWNSPEIQDLMALLYAIRQPTDSQAVISCLHLPLWGVSAAGRFALNREHEQDDRPLIDRLLQARGPEAFEGLSAEDFAAAVAGATALRDLHVRSLERHCGAQEILFDALDQSGYMAIPELERQVEQEQAVANLQRFEQLLDRFMDWETTDTRLAKAIDYLEAVRSSGRGGALGEIEGRVQAVNLMTAHASKGLEWSVVMLPRCVASRWPGRAGAGRRFAIPDELVEEPAPAGDAHTDESRRLAYVAMTRARDRLILGAASAYRTSFRDEHLSPFVDCTLAAGVRVVDKPFIREGMTARRAVDTSVTIDHISPSISDLADFDVCPRRYEFRARFKMPTMPSPAQWFGTMVHAVLAEGGRMRHAGLEADGEVLARLWEEQWEAAPRHARRGLYPELREQGASWLRAYAATPAWQEAVIAEVEKDFLTREARVRGRFDRVDVTPQGVPTIVDYKTGAVPEDDSRLARDIQVRGYAVGLAERDHLAEVDVELHFLQDSSVHRVHFDAALLRKAKGHIGVLSSRIREAWASGVFEPDPKDWKCSRCPFQVACRKTAPKRRTRSEAEAPPGSLCHSGGGGGEPETVAVAGAEPEYAPALTPAIETVHPAELPDEIPFD